MYINRMKKLVAAGKNFLFIEHIPIKRGGNDNIDKTSIYCNCLFTDDV